MGKHAFLKTKSGVGFTKKQAFKIKKYIKYLWNPGRQTAQIKKGRKRKGGRNHPVLRQRRKLSSLVLIEEE